MSRLKVGDRVTVQTSDADPLEISLHRHAAVTEVQTVDKPPGGVTYMVGHPWMSDRCYGPYGGDRLVRGWNTP